MPRLDHRSARDVAGMRLLAQHLVGTPFPDAATAVRTMTCLQAQNLLQGREAVAVRTADRSLAGIDAALAVGSVVRSWPMRGTLHLVAAEDLGWMLEVTGRATDRTLIRRHAELGLTPQLLERATHVTVELLTGRGLTRAELVAAWRERGLVVEGQLVAHLLGVLSRGRVIVLGPMAGNQQQFRLMAEWVPHQRHLERDAAIAVWAERYFVSHGPATVRDFAWWTKLGLQEVSPVLDDLRGRLETMRGEDTAGREVELLCAPGLPDAYADLRRRTAAPVLAPGFDEILLGYADRGATLPTRFTERVTPGKNGIFLPIVLHRAVAVATWRRPAARAEPVGVDPFDRLPDPVRRALPRLTRDWPQR